MNRKPLEGIESLLFVLGAAAGYILKVQDYSWWIVLLAILVMGIVVGKFVSFLRMKNKQLGQ